MEIYYSSKILTDESFFKNKRTKLGWKIMSDCFKLWSPALLKLLLFISRPSKNGETHENYTDLDLPRSVVVSELPISLNITLPRKTLTLRNPF